MSFNEGSHGDVASAFGPALSGVISGAFRKGPRLPSFLHGWSFLDLVVSDDEEALAFKAAAQDSGPCIVINPMFVSPEDLEAPNRALYWLCPSLAHICHVVLLECVHGGDPVGRFAGPAWEAFRDFACQHAAMGWDEIIAAARREGVDFMSEHLAACLFVESGLQERILARLDGERRLKIA